MVDHYDPEYPKSEVTFWCPSSKELKSPDPKDHFKPEYEHGSFVSYILTFVGARGKEHHHIIPHRGCYGNLSTQYIDKSNQLKSFSFAVRRRSDIDTDDLLSYLLDKQASPYRKLLAEYSVSYYKKTQNIGSYISIEIDNKISPQLLMSFVIACRYGLDNPGGVRLFNYLLSKGFKLAEAFYVTFYFYLSRKGEINITDGIDLYSFSGRYHNLLTRVKNGDPHLTKNKTFLRGYDGLQGMWRDGLNKPELYNLFVLDGDYKGEFEKLYLKVNKSSKLNFTSLPTKEEILEKKTLIEGLR